jgi:hypothetical protein
MTLRTLITERDYFGMDAFALRAATSRVLARLAGLPAERVPLSPRNLRHDFALDTIAGGSLVRRLVDDGLLVNADAGGEAYHVTDRFIEIAGARVVEPLTRERARKLVQRAALLARDVNDRWTRNPLRVELLAPYGAYMSREHRLEELPLGVVVGLRDPYRCARWGRMLTRREGARQLRGAFSALSSFMRVKLANDSRVFPRPFAVAFEDR